MIVHPISDLSKILAIRARLDAMFYVESGLYNYTVRVQDAALVLECVVPLKNPDGTDNPDATTVAGLLSYANSPVDSEQATFESPDYTRVDTWNGDTNGDPVVKWLYPNAVFNVLLGMWLTAPLEQGGQPIPFVYDDVNFEWRNANGVVVCHLDKSAETATGAGNVWRSGTRTTPGPIICQYDLSQDEWVATGSLDGSVTGTQVTTSSRLSIVPYPNTKLVMMQVILRSNKGVTFQAPLHFLGYSFADKDPTGAPIPPGIYLGRDWVYPDLAKFIAGANGPYHISESFETPDPSPRVSYSYDYAKSQPFVIDSRLKQRIDVYVEGHRKLLNATHARATFVCVKKGSF